MQDDSFHALVGCKVAKKVWRLSIFANSVINHQSTNFSCFAQSLADSMSKESFESLVVLAWSIWRDRKLFVHNNVEHDTLGSIIRAESVLKNYKIAQQSLATGVSKNQIHKEERWLTPPNNWYKLNTDAAIKSSEGICGLGAIIRNSRGEVMAASVNTRPFSGD